MTVTRTPRLNIHLWSSGADTLTRDQLNSSHQELEDRVATYSQATTRPSASAANEGAIHYNSSTRQLSYCNGSAWLNINAIISSSNPQSLNGSASAGTTSQFSDAGHKHAFSNNSIALSKISSSGASNNYAIGYDSSGNITWIPLVPDGSVTLSKFSTTRTDWDSSATSAADLAGKLIGFNSSGNPAIVDSSSNINSVGLEHLAHLEAAASRTGPTQRVIGFNASGTPVIVDNVPSRSVGLNQLATGTPNKLLGFDADGEPAALDPTPADGSITLNSFQTVSGNANKLIGYNASGTPTARDPFVADGTVALSALANGTANKLIGYNASGNPAEVDNAPPDDSINLRHLYHGTPGKFVGWAADGTPGEFDPIPDDYVELKHFKHQTGQTNKVLGYDDSGDPAFLDNVPAGSVGLTQMATGTANRIIGYNASGTPTLYTQTPAADSIGLNHIYHGTAGKVLGYNSSGEPAELDLVPDNSVTLAKLAHGTAGKVLGFGSNGAPAQLDRAYNATTLHTTSTSLRIPANIDSNPQWVSVDLSDDILNYDLISMEIRRTNQAGTSTLFRIFMAIDAVVLGNASVVTSTAHSTSADVFHTYGIYYGRADANTIRLSSASALYAKVTVTGAKFGA